MINYARAIGLYVPIIFQRTLLQLYCSIYSSTECFGIHIGNPQSANLGDGNGWVNQSVSNLGYLTSSGYNHPLTNIS